MSSGASNRRSQAMPDLPATSASRIERSAITGAASSAARVRLAETTWKRVEPGPGPLGIPHPVLIQHDAEVPGTLAHLVQSAAAVAQQIDQRHALGIEQLEGEPHPLRRSSILAKASAMSASRSSLRRRCPSWSRSAMPICASASLASPVPCAASALGRVKWWRAMSRVCLLDPGGLGREAQLLQRLDPDSDLVGGLADRVGRGDRAVHERGEAANRGHARERATEGTDAGPQQLGLAAQVLEPARGFAACGLDVGGS